MLLIFVYSNLNSIIEERYFHCLMHFILSILSCKKIHSLPIIKHIVHRSQCTSIREDLLNSIIIVFQLIYGSIKHHYFTRR